jgi:hypothetical protein
MSTEYTSVAGIGIEVDYKDVINKYYERVLTDEELDQEDELDILERFVHGEKDITLSSACDGNETRYFYFASDPINGLESFIHAMIFKDFPIAKDDLQFYSVIDRF